MAPMDARYGHTNLVARDWRRLAGFYVDPFGCVPVPPERAYPGGRRVTWCYVTDPEGNIVELQAWSEGW
jgi:hypothetical protein